ncbi:uncharacterized protein LOC110112690 [Dendrobium catenatum]|uniref:uncharacterized protein LOC110112690 n=1 Tax=Dendrobium catenatum TaxID=906689 RepID=UPI00109F820F|nr:uncharacterized protein LOC110112690 [Dendrobium catenatum]
MYFPTFASWNVRGFNSPEKVSYCKSLIKAHDLKLLCILEAKVSPSSVNDPWFLRSHSLYENEGSCNNFLDSTPSRIWIKWDKSVFSFQQLFSSSQLIHGVLSVGSFPPIFLFVIYAVNSVEEWKFLWEQLLNMTPPLDQPWMLMGDFNCCRFESEKEGGSCLTSSRLGELNSMIFNCGVQDLSSTGLFYTWFNQRLDNPFHIKLDRVLVSNAFLDFLPIAYYTVEPPLGSDHSPLIFKSSQAKPISARFMFKNYWINMEGFWDDVLTAFSSRSSRSPMAAFYLVLNNNLKNINDELAPLQAKWNSWITQRAKVLWLTHGEDDLGFLYAKFRSRNNKNSIKEITTSEGHFTNFKDISHAIVKHFESLFNNAHSDLELPLNIPPGNLVPPNFLDMLVAPLSFLEVKSAVFDGNENSAPGPDGYTYAFYIKSWHLLGLQVFNVVNNFFTTSSLPRGVKDTAIALIPKCSHASNINDFRPISLCNVLYKIVAKIIANRLKVVLPFIVHDSQSDFIADRCSTDNIILASEILRDFKGSRKSFCAKLDIKKVFDSVSREFLIARLLQKGFPKVFVSWIRGYGLSNILTTNYDTFIFKGRVLFLKFTITNTIAYWIRGSIIPKGCCAKLNKLCSRFLFNNNLVEKKLHLISWSKVTQPKVVGGLGLPSLDALYFGVLCSIIGRFYNTKNLLSCWYKAKYTSPWKPPPSTASNFWLKVTHTAHRIREKISFSVSNSCELSFLWDPWINGKVFTETCSLDFYDMQVSDFICNGIWQLPDYIPSPVADSILAVNFSEYNEVLWNGSHKWVFRNFIEHYYSIISKVDWHTSIWHKHNVLKFASFTRMAVIGKLKTADNLNLRGIQTWEDAFWDLGHFVLDQSSNFWWKYIILFLGYTIMTAYGIVGEAVQADDDEQGKSSRAKDGPCGNQARSFSGSYMQAGGAGGVLLPLALVSDAGCGEGLLVLVEAGIDERTTPKKMQRVCVQRDLNEMRGFGLLLSDQILEVIRPEKAKKFTHYIRFPSVDDFLQLCQISEPCHWNFVGLYPIANSSQSSKSCYRHILSALVPSAQSWTSARRKLMPVSRLLRTSPNQFGTL